VAIRFSDHSSGKNDLKRDARNSGIPHPYVAYSLSMIANIYNLQITGYKLQITDYRFLLAVYSILFTGLTPTSNDGPRHPIIFLIRFDFAIIFATCENNPRDQTYSDGGPYRSIPAPEKGY
jgi:hypothetical protein